jgi:uncharacterized protein
MRDNVEVIESVWEAFGRGDVDKAASAIADKGEIVSPPTLPWGGTYVGPDGFKDFLVLLTGQFKDFKARAVKVLGADDNHVAVVARTTGRTNAGNELDVEVVWLYELRDGSITRAVAFTDTAAILEAIG